MTFRIVLRKGRGREGTNGRRYAELKDAVEALAGVIERGQLQVDPLAPGLVEELDETGDVVALHRINPLSRSEVLPPVPPPANYRRRKANRTQGRREGRR